MKGIIEAILDMEQKAEDALLTLQREKDRLSFRVEAETSHAIRAISQQGAAAVHKLKEEAVDYAKVRVKAIQENSTKQLEDLEVNFAKYEKVFRAQLLKEITNWTTMP